MQDQKRYHCVLKYRRFVLSLYINYVHDNQKKQILFFDADKIGVEKGYTFRAESNYFAQGFVSQEGMEHVDVSLRF